MADLEDFVEFDEWDNGVLTCACCKDSVHFVPCDEDQNRAFVAAKELVVEMAEEDGWVVGVWRKKPAALCETCKEG